MFQRRVFLLGVMAIVLFMLLLVRLGWMTLGEGARQARSEAAKKLVRETWLPTVRGTIYDRKGRVLAGDRASYDIAVDYRVLSGQWVYRDRSGRLRGVDFDKRAAVLAKRYNIDVWDDLEQSQQDEIIASFESAMRDRIDMMYQYISEQSGVPMDELMLRRDKIIEQVSKIKAGYTRRARHRELSKYAERGAVPTDQDLKRIESIASSPVREEEQYHALVSDVDDVIGFTFLRQSARSSPLINRVGDSMTDESDRSLDGVPVLPGLSVVDTTSRIYPYRSMQVQIDRSSFPPPLASESFVIVKTEDVGSMLLGTVRSGIQREDRERRRAAIAADDLLADRSLTSLGTDRGRYFTDDSVGRSGIEKSYEDRLRGLRGVSVENLQTGEYAETAPSPGLDIQLTLDIALQARIRAILDPKLGLTRVQSWHGNLEPTTPVGTELDAGVVVIEIATGEILSMVSTPVPPTDGDWTKYGVHTELDKRLFDVVHSPYMSKAIATPYPPGSVAKALILVGAAKYGKYEEGHRIKATGSLYIDQPNRFRSWIFKQNQELEWTHHTQLGRDPDAVDALMVSSNVFFFTLGRDLGPELVAKVYNEFGVGTAYGLGVGREWGGSIGGLNTLHDGHDVDMNDATMMGIGQGSVTWTPLHAADAYATLARQGYQIHPKIIRDGRAPVVSGLDLPRWSIQNVHDGLYQVSNSREFGSGFGVRYQENSPSTPTFNVPGIRVLGKTGTAAAPSIYFDPDQIGDTNGPAERILMRKGDHSWYVTLVGREGGEPEYAIAVIMEYAGSGGKVSGPINNQIVHALVAEGYLPRIDPVTGEELLVVEASLIGGTP